MRLPLVEWLVSQYSDTSLENVRIIACQHILETTHAMFRALYTLGLKPQNVSLIGKCYSTNTEVLEEMRADGLDVSEFSTSYQSHTSFDKQYDRYVRKFIESRVNTDALRTYERVILLDDGGLLIPHAMKACLGLENVIGIEQTSSGYMRLQSLFLPFSVINVARSDAKRLLETPAIAKKLMESLAEKLGHAAIEESKFLLLGGGVIGQAIHSCLKERAESKIFDIDPNRSHLLSTNFHRSLRDYNVIIGCTGSMSLPVTSHSRLRKGTTLISASSSDREFDAVHLRRHLPPTSNCWEDAKWKGLTLVNGGFPINFSGHRQSVSASAIQLTRALLAGAIIQASRDEIAGGQFIALDSGIQHMALGAYQVKAA